MKNDNYLHAISALPEVDADSKHGCHLDEDMMSGTMSGTTDEGVSSPEEEFMYQEDDVAVVEHVADYSTCGTRKNHA